MQIQTQEEYKYKYKKIQIKHEHLIYNLQVVAHQQLRYFRWARGNQYNTNITRIAKAALHKLPPSAAIRKEINKVGIVFVVIIAFVSVFVQFVAVVWELTQCRDQFSIATARRSIVARRMQLWAILPHVTMSFDEFIQTNL